MGLEKSYTDISEIGSSFTKGTLFLFAGRTLSYVIAFLGFIIIARLIASIYGSAEPLGWIYLTLALLSLIQVVGDLGIGTGVTNKFIVNYKKGLKKEAAQYFWTGCLFSFSLSLMYALLTLFLGNFIVLVIYQKPEVLHLLPLISLSFFAQSSFYLAWGGCILLDKTWINGLMIAIQSLIHYSLAILLLLTGYGIWGLVLASFVAAPLTASLPGFYVIFKNMTIAKPSFKKLREAFKFGSPITAGGLSYSLASSLSNTLISRIATSLELGYFSAAQRLGPLLDVFLYPLNQLLFPTISKIDNGKELRTTFNLLSRFIALIVFPICVILALFSKEIITALFGQAYADSWPFLPLLSLVWLTNGLGGLVIGYVLMAQGKTTQIFQLNLIGAMLTAVLSIILIPLFNIVGAILVSFIAFWPPYILSLKYVLKEFNLSLPYKSLLLNFTLTLTSFLPSLLLIHFLTQMNNQPFPKSASLFSSILAGGLLYLYSIKKFKLINDNELAFLEFSLNQLPFAGKLIGFALNVYKKI